MPEEMRNAPRAGIEEKKLQNGQGERRHDVTTHKKRREKLLNEGETVLAVVGAIRATAGRAGERGSNSNFGALSSEQNSRYMCFWIRPRQCNGRYESEI